MSVRRSSASTTAASGASKPNFTASPQSAATADAVPDFESLSPTEKSCAALGVDPDAYRPISFLNEGHYRQLIAANALDNDLARRIAAYSSVAAGDAATK